MLESSCRTYVGFRTSRGLAAMACLALLAVSRPASPQSRNAEDYVFLAKKGLKISKGSRISANVAVNEPGGRLGVSPSATLDDGTQIVGDSVTIGSESRVFDVFADFLRI